METASNTLSEIQLLIKQALETLPKTFWVTAEINELKISSVGHCYLSLIEKDTFTNTLKAKASATIWASNYTILKSHFETTSGQPLRVGIRVLVKATVQYHTLYGLSLSITDINATYTLGELALQRRRTIARLQADGVYDMNRRTRLPVLPQRIAVISSEQAAGYQDFIHHLACNDSGFAFRTQLFPSLMQGTEAVRNIIDSLALVNEQREAFDAVVIIRGGGSAADLACFDDYELALHVAQFSLPVLTGIGHDKDESIVDLVAHRLLKTPTAVADFLIECMAAQDARLHKLENTLRNTVHQRIQGAKNKLTYLTNRRKMAVKLYFQKIYSHLQLLEKEIQYKDPATILARGYAVVLLNGDTVRDAAQVRAGDALQITLYKGKIHAEAKTCN